MGSRGLWVGLGVAAAEVLRVPAVLFSIVPQLFDVVAACIFISAELQVWIAVIVLITLGSYVPLTVILTELRVKYRRWDKHP